jgi:hypothetical protein
VLRYATESPGSLDTSPLPLLSDSPRSYTRYIGEDDCGEEMRTKVSIVRVCGLWWHLAIGLLYEFVRIRESSTLHLLVKTLEGSSSDRLNVQNNQPLGWYVKCILGLGRPSYQGFHEKAVSALLRSPYILAAIFR